MFAILFSGSFNYNLNSNTTTIDRLVQCIKLWQSDLQNFREIVTDEFLANRDGLGSSAEATVFAIDTL
jgi:hypothetical protein